MAYLALLPILDQSYEGLVVKNCKSSTSDKLQKFKPIVVVSCNLLTKNSIYIRNTFFAVATLEIEITEPPWKIKTRINDLKENVMH